MLLFVRIHHENQYQWGHAWTPKELNPNTKANGFFGSRPAISNAPDPEVCTVLIARTFTLALALALPLAVAFTALAVAFAAAL